MPVHSNWLIALGSCQLQEILLFSRILKIIHIQTVILSPEGVLHKFRLHLCQRRDK